MKDNGFYDPHRPPRHRGGTCVGASGRGLHGQGGDSAKQAVDLIEAARISQLPVVSPGTSPSPCCTSDLLQALLDGRPSSTSPSPP